MSESQPPTMATVEAVLIETTRLETLAEFYRAGFGLGPPIPTGADHLGFKTGAVYLGLDRVQHQAGARPGSVVIWFRVHDVAAVFEHLLALGATAQSAPRHEPWGETLATVLDPDGNLIGLLQPDKVSPG